MSYAKEYTAPELMAVTAAKRIRDRDIVFIGIGVPLMAGLLAKLTHAPNITLVFETGLIGPQPSRMIWFIDDNGCHDGAFCVTTLCRVFSDLQRGYYDLGILGAAQVDRYGNINSTAIGDYRHPRARLPGSGGANDIGSSANNLLIMASLEKRRFVSQLDYLTTPGYLEGGDSRRKSGLRGGGPVALISDKCVFEFEEQSKEMVLHSLHPGVSVEEIKNAVSWDIRLCPQLEITEPPTQAEIELVRMLDPSGFVLRGGLSAISFEDWAGSVEYTMNRLKSSYKR